MLYLLLSVLTLEGGIAPITSKVNDSYQIDYKGNIYEFYDDKLNASENENIYVIMDNCGTIDPTDDIIVAVLTDTQIDIMSY